MQTLITATKIPAGSYEIRIWEDEDTFYGPIDTVCVLRNNNNGSCEVAMAFGKLTHDIIITIGLKAYELGFKKIEFYVPKGNRATHYATYSHSDEEYDYYYADLEESVAKYLAGELD